MDGQLRPLGQSLAVIIADEEAKTHETEEPTSKRPRRGPKGKIQLQELKKLYGMPLHEAAKAINVCESAIKKFCRKRGISQWPYRQLRSIEVTVENLDNQLKLSSQQPLEVAGIQKHIDQLKEKKAMLLAQPEGGVVPTHPRRRRRVSPTSSTISTSSEQSSASTNPFESNEVAVESDSDSMDNPRHSSAWKMKSGRELCSGGMGSKRQLQPMHQNAPYMGYTTSSGMLMPSYDSHQHLYNFARTPGHQQEVNQHMGLPTTNPPFYPAMNQYKLFQPHDLPHSAAIRNPNYPASTVLQGIPKRALRIQPNATASMSQMSPPTLPSFPRSYYQDRSLVLSAHQPLAPPLESMRAGVAFEPSQNGLPQYQRAQASTVKLVGEADEVPTKKRRYDEASSSLRAVASDAAATERLPSYPRQFSWRQPHHHGSQEH